MFSYVGLATVEVPINNRNVVNVSMKESGIELDEVVAIGYGTVKKADLTGAVLVVKPEDYSRRTNTSVGDMLLGAAGKLRSRDNNCSLWQARRVMRAAIGLKRQQNTQSRVAAISAVLQHRRYNTF